LRIEDAREDDLSQFKWYAADVNAIENTKLFRKVGRNFRSRYRIINNLLNYYCNINALLYVGILALIIYMQIMAILPTLTHYSSSASVSRSFTHPPAPFIRRLVLDRIGDVIEVRLDI